MIKITLKDGTVKEYEAGIAAYEVAKDISMKLYKVACAVKINGIDCDLRTPIIEDCTLEIFTFEQPQGKHAFWHTSSHILAQAVLRLYPDAKIAIGPAIENGFYYDFDIEKPFTDEDLQTIQDEMKKIVKEALPITRKAVSVEEARDIFANQPYKLELLEKHAGAGDDIMVYSQGEFTDLCAGPHLMDTSAVKAIQLTNATGAYWHGDSNLPMLSRIYGISFPKKSELDAYMVQLEEAKRRDHRKIGKEMALFALKEEGPGFPFFLPNGMILKNELLSYWREIHTKNGYKEISTPIMLNRELWERSGHWAHYKENMYTSTIDDTEFAIKPMNCPGSILVYQNDLHSYRELPLRLAELGTVHRNELSGALHGLMRVRSFTQDDAHIYITPEQIEEEVTRIVNIIDKLYAKFGFEYHIELSTMPDDHMGSLEVWEQATAALKKSMHDMGKDYSINEGDGAFYGPKLDFHLVDAIGRTWQCGTVQLDFQLPERFELEYIGEDGEKHRPIMIHRVAFGSVERFIGILIEHFAGWFPTWLAPTQVELVPISQAHHEYAQQVVEKLQAAGIRAHADMRNEKMNYKIREAQLQKVPYTLVMGDKEVENGTVSVRAHNPEKGGVKSVDTFIQEIQKEIQDRTNN